MEIEMDLWEQIKEALIDAEWGFDRYGEFGTGLQNAKVAAVLNKLGSMGEVLLNREDV